MKLILSISLLVSSMGIKAQTVQEYYEKGTEQLQLYHFAAAIEAFTKAIQMDQGVWYIYFNRALAYYNISDFESALSDLNQTLELNPNQYDALVNRGNIKDALGDYHGALDDFELALKVGKPSCTLYNGIGITYDNLKEYDKALKYFSKSIELKEDNPEAYDNRAMVKRKMGDLKGCCEDLLLAIKYTERGQRAQNHYNLYCK